MLLGEISLVNLRTRGIIGYKPDERVNSQDIRINATIYADIEDIALNDSLVAGVNYRTLAKKLLQTAETANVCSLERLAYLLLLDCFSVSERVARAKLTVEKLGAIRYAESASVSLSIDRKDVPVGRQHRPVRPGVEFPR